MWRHFFRGRQLRSAGWMTRPGEPSDVPLVITLAPGVTAAPDSTAAAWIAPRLAQPERTTAKVGAVIPTGYAAYARIFHPARVGEKPVKWSDVSSWSGRVAHAQMQWEAISVPTFAVPEAPPWDIEPDRFVPAEVREPLCEILRAHTQTPERCWICLWEGYGGLEETLAGIPRVHHAWGRDYALLRAPIDAIAGGVLSDQYFGECNLWWPDDRAWCVATEIDFCWTYVGGTAECVRDILADARLEAIATEPEHIASFNGDVINGPVRS